MKNLVVIVAVVFSGLLSSCTLEQSLGSVGALLDSEDGASILSAEQTWGPEVRIIKELVWAKEGSSLFLHPMEYNGNVIYDGYQNSSVNALTGNSLWGHSAPFLSRDANKVLVADKIYYINKNTINVLDAASGDLTQSYEWADPNERLGGSFDIAGGRLYADLRTCDNTFAGLVSCDLQNIGTGDWSYHDLAPSGANIGYCGGVFRVQQAEYIGESFQSNSSFFGDVYLYFSSPNAEIEGANSFTKYNLTQEKIVWVYDDASVTRTISQITFDEDNIILGTIKNIYSIQNMTGELNWHYEMNENFDYTTQGSEFYIQEDKIFSFSMYGISALDVDSGTLLWEMNLPFKEYGSPEYEEYAYSKGFTKKTVNFYKDKIYYASNKGQLIKLDMSNGYFERCSLPRTFTINEETIREPNFEHQHLIVTTDGMVITRIAKNLLVAFQVPE